MHRYLFFSLAAAFCFAAHAVQFVLAPIRWAISEAFPDARAATIETEAQLRAVGADMPSAVSTYVDRRLARQPARRRGPWADLSVGLPLAA